MRRAAASVFAWASRRKAAISLAGPAGRGGVASVLGYRPSESPVPDFLAALSDLGLTVQDLATEETDLEDLFLQLTRGAHDTPIEAPRTGKGS